MRPCNEDDLAELVQAIENGDAAGLELAERLLADHPEDARLHFLRGSLLAGTARNIEAHESLRQAVEIAPDFHVARYQLGFFQLTSGEADAALSTWGPLHRLSEDNYLRCFVEAMAYLIRDEFDAAIAGFKRGIALNHENPAMNGDIRLLIAQCEKLAVGASPATDRGNDDRDEDDGDDSGPSATSLLLGGIPGNQTRH